MPAKRNRYLGVQPFTTSDRHLFFGRDEDIENLHDFLMLEKLVVLFGKSGYGKSSLLSAGIVPRLTDEDQPKAFRFTPIEVRFGTYIEGQSFSPLETTQRIIDKIPKADTASFLDEMDVEPSLWLQLKQRQSADRDQFVLIFDQFEELFSYPSDQQLVFRRQLAELLYATIPAQVRDQLEGLAPEQLRFAVHPLNNKAVLSIRSDRMSLLDSMKDVLPAILHKRYELKPLTPTQAREAIIQPALKGHDDGSWEKDFHTPPFEYTEAALHTITQELTSELNKGIEAFQLQIVCEEIERAIQQGRVPDRDDNGLPDVDLPDLPDFRNLYENYYRSKLSEIPEDQRLAAQRVLEDGLLATDPATGEGRRMSVDSRALIGQFASEGLTDDLLRELAKTYLIRREANTVGGFSYEISHDTLVAPVQKAKAERLAAEERAKAAKRVRRLLGIVGVVILLLVGSIFLVIYTNGLRSDAEIAKNEAEAKTQEAIVAQQKADSLKIEAQKNLRTANEALIEVNREKLRAAEANLSGRKQALKRYKDLFPGQTAAIRKVQNQVNRAQTEVARYTSIIDSIQAIINP